MSHTTNKSSKKKILTSWLSLLQWNHLRTLFHLSSFLRPYRSIHAIYPDELHQIDPNPILRVASILTDVFPICHGIIQLLAVLVDRTVTISIDMPDHPNCVDGNWLDRVWFHSNVFRINNIRIDGSVLCGNVWRGIVVWMKLNELNEKLKIWFWIWIKSTYTLVWSDSV